MCLDLCRLRSIQRQRLVLDLSYSTSRQLEQKQDQSKPLVTTETTKIQAHLVKSLSVRKAASSQKKVSSGFTKQMVLEDLLTRVLVKTKQQHSPKLVVDLYSQSVEYQNPVQLQNLLLEPPYSMERQKKVSLQILQRILQHLHYLEQELLAENTNGKEQELLLSKEVSSLLLVSNYLTTDLVHSVYLVVLPSQQSNHLLQEQFLQRSVVSQKQDTSKYSKTSFHLVLLHFLENLHIQISITHLYTQHLELQQFLVLLGREDLSERLVLVLLLSLVDLLSDLQQTISKEQSSSIQRVHPQLPNFTGCTHLQHLVLQQYLVSAIREKSRIMVTTEMIKIQAHQVDLHSPIHHLYTHLSITHLRLVLVLQSFIRPVDLLQRPSHLPTTKHKEDSKALLDLKNLSLVQLMLVLVRLIPSVLLQLRRSPSRNQELTLLLFNSYK